MNSPKLVLLGLFAGGYTLATSITPAMQAWAVPRPDQSGGVLVSLLGESRKLFSNHVFLKSDAYMHSGYYPSIFDEPTKEGSHVSTAKDSPAHGEPGHVHEAACETAGPSQGHHHSADCDHDEEENFLGRPRNWIDSFGRHFFPSRHTHLETATGQAREILPWVKLSAELDPTRVATYTVGAYWLRQLGKSDEATQFLRQGLRSNPGDPELLFELGRSYFEQADRDRARNVWELALTRWREVESGLENPNYLLLAQMLTRLTQVEVESGNREAGVRYLSMLKPISPHPDQIDQRIAEVRAGKPFVAQDK